MNLNPGHGSHVRLLHSRGSELRVTVAYHSRDLPRRTLTRILRQADLTPEELGDLL